MLGVLCALIRYSIVFDEDEAVSVRNLDFNTKSCFYAGRELSVFFCRVSRFYSSRLA